MRTLAIIPARSGSKRLVSKNIMSFNGIPLVVRAAKLGNKCADYTIISMDSYVDAYNIEGFLESLSKVEIVMRPVELAQDNSSTESVVLYHLTSVQFKDYDTLVLLQCTSPLFEEKRLEEMLKLFEDEQLPALATVYNGKFDGSCIIIKRDVFEKEKTFWVKGMAIFKLDQSVDIDDLSDFRVAEAFDRGDVYIPKDTIPIG
jgi:CMP-N-acetylneuraminic acid synthetase